MPASVCGELLVDMRGSGLTVSAMSLLIGFSSASCCASVSSREAATGWLMPAFNLPNTTTVPADSSPSPSP